MPARRSTSSPAVGPPRARAWFLYAWCCLAGIAGYFLLPSTVWQNVAFIASNVIGLTAVAVGTHRNRPPSPGGWRLLAVFPAFTAAGNVVWLVNDDILHIDPFPSWGDFAFIAGYVGLAAALLLMVRARTPARDLASVLDAGIVTTGFAVVSWVFIMSPLVAQEDTLVTRVVALCYPAGNVLVLAVAARLFMGPASRGAAYRLLGLNLAVQLGADVWFAILNLAGSYNTGHPVDALQLAYNLGWGVVALHPAMTELTRPQPAAQDGFKRPRLVVLTLASLIAPAVLVWQAASHHHDDMVVTAGGAAVLFSLVVARMAGLLRALEGTLAERRALEAELQHRAAHDALTGLANRNLFAERVAGALEAPSGCAVLFLDLDDFKGVNDRLGHAAGDQLLRDVARRLEDRLGDRGLVARLGGDEFAVLVDARDGEAVATDLLHALDARASIGVAVADRAQDAGQLLAEADAAMYAAKAMGKGTHRCFEPAMAAGVVSAPFVADAPQRA